jgi:Ring finger domain
MTEEDYYDEYNFHDDPDDPEYINHLPGEIVITNDNYEDMVRRFMLGVRQTHMGVHRDT